MIRHWWAAVRRQRPAAAPVAPPARPRDPEPDRVRADIAVLRAELRLLMRDGERATPSATPGATQREDAQP